MVTKVPHEELVRRGKVYPASLVIAQAHYTFGLLDGDEKVRAKLGAKFLAEAKKLVAQLEAAVGQRQLAAAAATQATRRQELAVEKGLAWVADLASCTRSAKRRGLAPLAPEALHVQLATRSPGAVALEIERLAKLAQEHLSTYAPLGVDAAEVKRGLDLALEIRAADEVQEVARRARRPEAVKRMRQLKTMVRVAITEVNDAAHRMYRGQPSKKAPWNVAILRRKVRAPVEGAATGSSPPADAREAS